MMLFLKELLFFAYVQIGGGDTVLEDVGSGSSNVTGNDTVILTKDVYVGGHTVAHPELCSRGSLRLIVLVASSPAHSAARDAVRLTWGHFARRSDVAIAFVLGQPPDDLRGALETENTLYNDIIMGNFVDSYSNLTLKTLFMLEWASSFCRAPFLLKTDDDMFINVPLLLDFLAKPQRANARRTIWGKLQNKTQPNRQPWNKYYLSPLQFPASVSPLYLQGAAYVMTQDCASLLLAAAGGRAYVRLEDVFITGVLAEAVGVKRENARRFFNRTRSTPLRPCLVKHTIAILTDQHQEMFTLWKNLFEKRKCSIRKLTLWETLFEKIKFSTRKLVNSTYSYSKIFSRVRTALQLITIFF